MLENYDVLAKFFASKFKPRCSHKRKNTNKVRAFFFVVRSTQNKLCLRTSCVALTLRVLFVCYVRCARFLQMLCACSSLCLRSPRLVASKASVIAERACLHAEWSVSRTESELRKNAPCDVSHASLGVRTKEKTRTKFVLSFLWCGHRDLNSDGVTIRPSNVRVCLFRHDRLTLLII